MTTHQAPIDTLTPDDTDAIRIVSGEGEHGTSELYTGKRTPRALKSRLTRERCHGDRWARAEMHTHLARGGHVWTDLVTGEMHGGPPPCDIE